jgi:alpha-tubulin suppressor-like RCC1 family protein
VYVHQGAQADDPNDANNPLEHIVDICAGSDQSIAVEKDDPSDPNFSGCVYTWGTNRWGDDAYEEAVGIDDGWGLLGNASDVNFSSEPVRVLSGEQDVGDPNSFLKHIVAVSAGWNHCMALENNNPWDPNLNGRVFTWGHNGPGWGGGDMGGEWERSVDGRLGNGTYTNSTPVLVLRPGLT